MSKTRRCLLDLWIAACCVGLGLFLPWAFRWVENGEAVLLLLQLPVLLCGMLCGPGYGLSCGMLLALLPRLLPGVQVAALSTAQLWELALYGFLAGFTSGFDFFNSESAVPEGQARKMTPLPSYMREGEAQRRSTPSTNPQIAMAMVAMPQVNTPPTRATLSGTTPRQVQPR